VRSSSLPDVPADPAWWRRAVVYQVYIRSFADGDGDGLGDLAGIRSRLGYLRDLGVDAIWVTPWYPSPMADGGYDVADYRDVDPRFGTLAAAEALIADAHAAGRLQEELTRLGRIPLIVIDEVGYIPFEVEAANLFFQLVSARYERASVIVTSNKPFGRWGEVFGDPVVAAAMIDRLVHHAEVISLKGDSYRLKDRDLRSVPNNNRE